MWKVLLFGMLTCGIYTIWWYWKLGDDLNKIIDGRDGRKTMNYLLAMLLGIVTCGVYSYVWFHQMSERVGNELRHRGFAEDFGAREYWIWFGGPTIALTVLSMPFSFAPLFMMDYIVATGFLPPAYWVIYSLFMMVALGVTVLMYVYTHKLCVAMNKIANADLNMHMPTNRFTN